MDPRYNPQRITPGLPEPAYDVGPSKNRWPLSDATVQAAAAANGVVVGIMPWDGWIEVAAPQSGLGASGWLVGDAMMPETSDILVSVGDFLPTPPGGRLRVTAPAGAEGTLRILGWSYAEGWVRAQSSGASSASASAGVPNGTTLESIEADGGAQTYTPPAGTLYTVVTVYDSGTDCAVGTDASVPVDIGPSAQLSSWTHYGTDDIYFHGVNAEFINFTNYTRT